MIGFSEFLDYYYAIITYKFADGHTEEIEVILADREEVKRILKEENVAIMTAYMLMHFLKDEDPFEFLN